VKEIVAHLTKMLRNNVGPRLHHSV